MNGLAENAGAPAHGLWRSRGYGWLAELNHEGFALHDISALSQAPAEFLSWPEARRALDFMPRASQDAFAFRNAHDVTWYWFDRVSAPLQRAIGPGDQDPLRNFEVFCAYFEENYAFSALRGADWAALRARFLPLLAAAPSDERLAEALTEIIAQLKDAHTSVTTPYGAIHAGSLIADRKSAVERAFGAPPWTVDRAHYTRAIQSAFGEMFLGGAYRALCNHMMICGEAAPGIGYLSFFGEFGFGASEMARTALDLPRGRVAAADNLAAEIDALNAGLDEAASILSGARALIVDARLNYGGYDRLALEAAGRFTDGKRLAYTKKAWTPQGFVAEQNISFELRRPSFAGLPIYLLTSRQTTSAGEIFALAMRACPNVTLIGEATLGILSDNLYKRLPNGWEVSLSNEIYQAADGGLFEAIGVPPDVECPVFDPADVRGGFGQAVRVAVAAARRDLGL